MKKWLVLICAVMMLMSTAMAEKGKRYNPGEYNIHNLFICDEDSEFSAGSKYCPGTCYRYVLLNDGTAEIVAVFKVSGDIELPRDLNGYTVTSIGQECFTGHSPKAMPTSIVIPDSVTYISERAFSSCYATEIFIPNSVTFIGYRAFGGCTNLTSIVIPDSVTAISDSTFTSCFNLQSVTIPDSVTQIARDAFYGCPNLTLTVTPGSYAEQYAIDNNIPYVYAAEATPAPDAEAGESAPADAFWTCTCGSLNDYNFCPNCGAARPVVEPTCSNCGYDPEGETPNFCPACGTQF